MGKSRPLTNSSAKSIVRDTYYRDNHNRDFNPAGRYHDDRNMLKTVVIGTTTSVVLATMAVILTTLTANAMTAVVMTNTGHLIKTTGTIQKTHYCILLWYY